jgi:hypothetical protein
MGGMEGESALGKPKAMNEIDKFLATRAGQEKALEVLGDSGSDLVAAGATDVGLLQGDVKHFRSDWLREGPLLGYWPHIDGDSILKKIRWAYRDAIQFALDHGNTEKLVPVNTEWICADSEDSSWFQVSWAIDGDENSPTSVTVTYLTPKPIHNTTTHSLSITGLEAAYYYDDHGNKHQAGT